MTTPEGEIKKKIKAYLQQKGAFWSMVQGGAFSKPGDPDIVSCYRGRYVAIEAKTPTGVQSKIQKTREEQIHAAGGVYILARSVDDVREVIEKMEESDVEEGQEEQEEGRQEE